MIESFKERLFLMVTYVVDNFDQISAYAFLVVVLVGILVATQLRGVGPVKFSFGSSSSKHLTPFGRVLFALFRIATFILIAFFIFYLFVRE